MKEQERFVYTAAVSVRRIAAEIFMCLHSLGLAWLHTIDSCLYHLLTAALYADTGWSLCIYLSNNNALHSNLQQQQQ